MSDSNEKILLENTGGSEAGRRLSGILAANPRLRAMIEKLSPEDTRKLGAVLSDSGQLAKIMASPEARKAAESLLPGPGGNGNGGK